jgi:hypothetical protein
MINSSCDRQVSKQLRCLQNSEVNNSRDAKNSRNVSSSWYASNSIDADVGTEIGTPRMLATPAARISATAGLTAGAVMRLKLRTPTVAGKPATAARNVKKNKLQV